MGDQHIHFTNSLSALIDFHLASMQSQLQMISPINDNNQYEEIIKSSEAKPKIFKPSVLIPIPKFDNTLNALTPKTLLNTFFAGKEMQDIKSTQEYTQTQTTPITEVSIGGFSSNQQISITTDSTTILEVKNATTASSLLSTLNSLQYSQNLPNLKSESSTENSVDIAFIRKVDNTTDKYNKILNDYVVVIKSDDEHEKQLTIKDIKNRKKFHDVRNYTYNITSNNSLSTVINESYTIGHNRYSQTNGERKKRSLELFFNSDVQVSN